MTDIDWWEKAESLRDRYPEVNVADAFPKVVDAYVAGQPGKTHDLPFEFVVDALILFRYAAGLTPEPQKETDVEVPKEMPTHAIIQVKESPIPPQSTVVAETPDLQSRKGCLGFLKK